VEAEAQALNKAREKLAGTRVRPLT
jgi:hypothetical protein